VGADAVLQAVEDRPQQQGGLQVAEAAFGFHEVLVAQGGVFGADVRVAGGDEVLAVQPLLGGDLGGVDLQAPVGLLDQPASQAGMVAQRVLGANVGGLVARFGLVATATTGVTGALLGDPGQLRLDPGDGLVALLPAVRIRIWWPR